LSITNRLDRREDGKRPLSRQVISATPYCQLRLALVEIAKIEYLHDEAMTHS
jgi:hypothetical protein